MELVSLAELDALLRLCLYAFAHRCFLELHPSKPLVWNWHLEVMAAKLQDCVSGEIRQLILCLPPKHMKSFFTSVVLPVWWLGHDPTAEIICASYGDSLSEVFARDRLTLMNSPFYHRVFATRLNKQASQEFVTTAGGGCLSTSVGGPLTGRGADLIILDDVMKADDARSKARRKRVNEWFEDSVATRLTDQRTGCMILCMHRVHQGDLVGHLLQQGHWDMLSLPVIAEQDETHVINAPLGQVNFRRKQGELLHPARMSQEEIDRVRKKVGPYNFAAQYQQSPAPLGGGLVKAEWFASYDPEDLPKFDQIVQSWDTAILRPGKLNSFSVCTTWGVYGKHSYLLHVMRQRLNYTALKRAVQPHASAFDATVILIEDRSSGIELIEDLIDEGVPGVTRYEPPRASKQIRLHAQTGLIEEGFVHLPRSALWRADFLDEVTNFPASNHSDQVDSMSQFLDWVRRCRHPARSLMQAQRLPVSLSMGGKVAPNSGSNFGFAFVNDAKPGPRMVRLRVPLPGPTYVYTLTGRCVLVPENRIIAVTEEEAPSLRLAGYVEVA